MPTRAPRPCSKAGCSQLTATGRCAEHPPALRARGKADRRYDDARGGARERGYDATWERLARSFLREHPLCAACEAEGVTAAAELVDHVRELRDGGARLDESNLQSLCRRCHARKTAAVAKERTWGRAGASRSRVT